MKADERALLIRKYRDGYDAVVKELDGMTDEELDRSAEDGWTPRQIVHHLADSALVGGTRIRFLLALDEPSLQGYDEKAFADRFAYDGPIEPSLELMRLMEASTARLLDTMSDDDWTRAGKHSERGRWTPEDWLMLHAPHAHDHAAQIRRARGKG